MLRTSKNGAMYAKKVFNTQIETFDIVFEGNEVHWFLVLAINIGQIVDCPNDVILVLNDPKYYMQVL